MRALASVLATTTKAPISRGRDTLERSIHPPARFIQIMVVGSDPMRALEPETAQNRPNLT